MVLRTMPAFLCCVLIGMGHACAGGPDGVFRQRETLAKIRAMDLFPEVEEEGSNLRQALAEEIARLEVREPAVYKDPNWPVRVTRWVAARLKIPPRSFHQIMNDQSHPFRLEWKDDPYFNDVVIYSAKYGLPDHLFDVTETVVKGMIGNWLMVKVDDSLLPMPSGGGASPRRKGESERDFWHRQQEELVTSDVAESKKERALFIEYECRGEKHVVNARRGEIVEIRSPAARSDNESNTAESLSGANSAAKSGLFMQPRMRAEVPVGLR